MSRCLVSVHNSHGFVGNNKAPGGSGQGSTRLLRLLNLLNQLNLLIIESDKQPVAVLFKLSLGSFSIQKPESPINRGVLHLFRDESV